MDEKFWHAPNVVIPAAWLTALLPDLTYMVVLLAGMVAGVMLLAFKHYAGRGDDFLRAGAIQAWRAVVSAVVKYLILLAFRVAAMLAAIITTRAARLAARRPAPPPAAPRHLPSFVLTPRLIPVPVLGRA